MSAVIGIYHCDGQPVNRADLERMVDILAHRGLDGSGIWSDRSIGLGHRMLWTTPESLSEKLPLVNHATNLTITADARIDNREELLTALGYERESSEKITDSQLILHAYEKWGLSTPEYLLGDFAFAIWDARQQTLFCARDHYGVKPFYYYSSRNTFVFATEIKALLCLPRVPSRLNEEKVGHYLVAALPDNTSTLYKDILRLPAGHHMTVSPNRTSIKSYWTLNPHQEICMVSDREYAEAFREIFAKAVDCRLRSAFPIGSHLSGGLDSSSIACVARDILAKSGRGSLHTFSANFETVPESDERYYQNAVLASDGFVSHYLPGEPLQPFTEDFERFLWHQEEAFLPANFYFCSYLEKLASSLGIRVMLDGHDGDTTVSHGNEYLRELARNRKWFALFRETQAYGKRHNLAWKKVVFKWYYQYGLIDTFKKSPISKLLKTTSQSKPQFSEPLWNIPLNSDFVERIQLTQRVGAIERNNFETERERHHHVLSSDLMQNILEFKDRSAAIHNIESRSPFCDKRLLEFCLALPAEQKLKDGYTRFVMRKAMEGILPNQVQWRVGKANFAFSLEQALLRHERDRFEKIIIKNSEAVATFIDVTAMRQAYERFISHNASEDDVNSLWRTVCLGSWLQQAGLTT